MPVPLIYKDQITLQATIGDVWKALTDPDLTKEYMYGCRAVTDWKVGSSLIWRGAADGVDYVIGQVVKYEPGSRLTFTVFDPNAGYEDKPENYLTSEYTLSAVDDSTVIKIAQHDFSQVENGEKRFEEAAAGWQYALEGLRKLLES